MDAWFHLAGIAADFLCCEPQPQPTGARPGHLTRIARDASADGTWKTPVSLHLKREQIAQLPSAEDREILSMLAGAIPYFEWGYAGYRIAFPSSAWCHTALAEKVISLDRPRRALLLST